MASGDTKTQQYLDIAANGRRADLPSDTCCETRTQTLIRGVAERIMDVEDEVERLENNPDVVDIVATYADLQAYDTQHLTDKDVIRVLQDETHDGNSTYYRYNKQTDTWTYIGESKQYTNFVGTDGTTAGEAGLVPAPAATDAGKFLKADGTWETVQSGATYTAGDGIDISAQDVISATNTGKAKILTSADYNWPATGTKTSVALWLLEPGLYAWDYGVRIAWGSSRIGNYTGPAIISGLNDGHKGIYLFENTAGANPAAWGAIVDTATGVFATNSPSEFITTKSVVNNLTSTSAIYPLSANQGRVLNTHIGDLTTLTTTAKTSAVAAINELDSEVAGKQDTLTAGSGISIAEESGALVISATGASISTISAQDWSALWQ